MNQPHLLQGCGPLLQQLVVGCQVLLQGNVHPEHLAVHNIAELVPELLLLLQNAPTDLCCRSRAALLPGAGCKVQ